MIVVDANILLYAYDASANQQQAAAAWLETTLAGSDIIAVPWLTAWAFTRIATNARTWRNPVTLQEAFRVIRDLLAQPGVIALNPGPRHWDLLNALATKYNAGGSRLTDTVLAALAIENGATLASPDRDFARFEELRWINPLQ